MSSGLTHLRIANSILLDRYDEDNIFELIAAILLLLKNDDIHKDVLVRMIRDKVNRRIREKIRNDQNIFDIIYKLIIIMNNNNNSVTNA